MLVVQKYGGTSVATPERIRRVAQRVVEVHRQGHRVVVVVSAMGDTTDELINLVHKITDNPPEREMDMLLSTGEQVSIALLAMAINNLGEQVISLTGPQVGILTDNVHTKARILEIKTDRINAELAAGKIVVVAGFQGINKANDITTLGRGGSDTTAVALAAALKADLCEIYTDVDGVFTADPRLVPDARKLPVISYDEMLELAHLGAGVLHYRSVECAKIHGIPIHVRSSFNHNLGTIVKEVGNMEKAMVVTGVAHDLNVAKIGLFDVPDRPGIAWRIFRALADENINVDMIIQSAMRDGINDISFTVSQSDLKKALAVVEKIKDRVGIAGYTYDENVAKVSIVGAGMVTNPGVAAMMFEALARENINLEMISTSEIKVSCIIKAHETARAVRALHRQFGLSGEEDCVASA
ncbi:aspartate kinase [Desulfofundulus thermobenzoicus]|uniref:Aspartokinase n=1 Tax=Desulfofundulus thermobenzoicus TaxID=29376 RepID=A0A6N7IPT2_9FIRM|nr:aspartate kinase [Desulfofundulus thermobenzoicus]MQL51577.1 aspartate kinase [Desulfofundulus thermobenzoicus]HHW42671.1 aspartate kinase [Desulfotomaculum sp.]